MPVVRGDATKRFLLQTVGIEKAKMMVIADDNPAMAHRTTSVSRQLNPTMRIVVRTRYMAEMEHLVEAGADTVIAEELESIVQLFGEVLRDYRIPPEEIEFYEELARRDGYAALLTANNTDMSEFACQPGADCRGYRTVRIRDRMPVTGKSLAALNLFEDYELDLKGVRRNGMELEDIAPDFVLQPGDEIVLSGSTNAFTRNAALFRPVNAKTAKTSTIAAPLSGNGDKRIEVEKAIDFKPQVGESICTHLEQIRRVFPTSPGCEECLQTGDSWVHLRVCLTCGHVGCCNDSKNKHATEHFHASEHPIMKSLERGEDWAWCFQDNTYL